MTYDPAPGRTAGARQNFASQSVSQSVISRSRPALTSSAGFLHRHDDSRIPARGNSTCRNSYILSMVFTWLT